MFKMVNFEVDPRRDIILVKVDGKFDAQLAAGIDSAALQVSLSMSASDVSYLAPGQSIRGVVSTNPDKYKIYEFYINKMQFPTSEQSVDLFVTLTPCMGKMKFYISDDFHTLFTDETELKNDGSALKLSDSRDINIIHKKSKVSVDGNGKKLNLEAYREFRMQGKRLQHIEVLNGKKLYVGVKTISAKEAAQQQKATAAEDGQTI